MKVLIVDDERHWAEMVGELLGPRVETLVASTRNEALALFQQHEDLALIVVDGYLDPRGVWSSAKPDTLPLVYHFRRTFHGPIIAASNDEEANAALCRAGCTRGTLKLGVTDLINTILKLAS